MISWGSKEPRPRKEAELRLPFPLPLAAVRTSPACWLAPVGRRIDLPSSRRRRAGACTDEPNNPLYLSAISRNNWRPDKEIFQALGVNSEASGIIYFDFKMLETHLDSY
jgi:hypothetical protein